ncbi:hypothetical protein [Mycolicibacterium llatzerense]|uniref:hypothetical protein n=1 Tax=Mycolicibacterium llatzerense TaxID=280871 RepID=UPI0021B68A9D|nr:hypothetical protein [Mycolicibacterium llatzerense]MCT7373377.1 hypothetical protein [Mycolicibacterium llatzerense]
MSSDNPLDGPEVAPRDVVSSTLGRLMPYSDSPQPDTSRRVLDQAAGEILADLDRAGFSVAARVWVAELDLGDDGGSYVAVHTTPEGAVAAIIRWAGEVGIAVDDLDTESGSETLDEHPDVRSYGVCYVPVQK